MSDTFDFLLENTNDGIYFLDIQRRITYWNEAATKITGYTPQEVLGRSCSDNLLIHVDENGENLCHGRCPVAHTICDGIIRKNEVYLSHKQGHRLPVWVRVAPRHNEKGEIIGATELFTDISAGAAIQHRIRELEKIALLDRLTRLSNRHHIEAELRARFEEYRRYGLTFGVIFMDIDHFKQFNDTYGHEVGDQVLRQVATTLKSAARPFDVFGRWGGEEFIGIIRNVDQQALAEIGNRCCHLIAKSYLRINALLLNVTVSAGATLARPEDTINTLLERVDRLMYRSKHTGRNRLTSDGNPKPREAELKRGTG